MNRAAHVRTLVAVAALAGLSLPVAAQTLGSAFAADYSVFDIGSVPGLPNNYGGLTFLDNDTLLIGGAANSAGGRLYTIDVVRDPGNQHVTGFAGTVQQWGTDVGEWNDGGVVFGPGGVLFTARWPDNKLGQTKPGSVDEDKIIDTAALGVAGSLSAINFVPAGFGGAGQIKLVTYGGGLWYSATLAPDGTGTYDLTGLAQVDLDATTGGTQNALGGPEGFVYITAGNAAFSANSMLISEYGWGRVGAYEVDANGDPLVATRRDFITGLGGAEGAAIDPVTGDFLFSTFGGGSRVIVVTGFLEPPPIPEPGTWALMGLGLAALATRLRRRS